MSSIKLHPEHGLNPTVVVCFWCGADHGLALLGAAYRGEAPRRMAMDYNPCEKCKARFEQGIVLVGVTEHGSDDRSPINAKWVTKGYAGSRQGSWETSNYGEPLLYPTGRYIVVSEDFVKRTFQPESVVAATLRTRQAFLDDAVLQKFVDSAKAQGCAGEEV